MAGTMEDEVLVGRFLQGDEAAFELIVTRYSDLVASLANRVLGWPGEVDDITQEVFLSVYKNLKHFRSQCSLKTWIYTITLNQCRSIKYRWRVRTRHLREKALESSCDRTGSLVEIDHESVRRAVLRLPARYREPVVLKYLEELPTDEICSVLKISRNNLNVRLLRAREQLRGQLER
jgi:RNA polymerase sigma-70 factor (ECF subfamily)